MKSLRQQMTEAMVLYGKYGVGKYEVWGLKYVKYGVRP